VRRREGTRSGQTTDGTEGNEDEALSPRAHLLHLFDAESETGSRIEGGQIRVAPDAARFPETTAPPDLEAFSPHGIGIGAQDGDTVTLYAANHGRREGMEVFEIDVSGATPVFTWIGTVLAPADGFVDAVAWIPGTDGFIATAVTNPLDAEAGEKRPTAHNDAKGERQ